VLGSVLGGHHPHSCPRNGKESGLICSVKFFSSDISHYRDRRSTFVGMQPVRCFPLIKFSLIKLSSPRVFLWYSLRTLPERLLLYARKGVAVAKGVVNINIERCKACGFCVEFCPTKVLAFSSAFSTKGYHPPHVVAPEKCSGCDLCGMYCPDFAIYAYRIKEPLEQKEVAHAC
jgi:2-oxoglutarate ferredoxin oxidoreductase subunit delta